MGKGVGMGEGKKGADKITHATSNGGGNVKTCRDTPVLPSPLQPSG